MQYKGKLASSLKKRHQAQAKSKTAKIYIFITLLIFVLILSFFFARVNKTVHDKTMAKKRSKTPDSPLNQIFSLLNTGEYDKVQTYLTKNYDRYSNSYQFENLFDEVMKELTVDFQFHYLPQQRSFKSSRPGESTPSLTTDDPYFLTFQASDICHVYILLLDPEEALFELFPNKEFTPHSNPFPSAILRIPDGSDWFDPDKAVGANTIYLIASRWKNEKLENLLQIYGLADSNTKHHQIIKDLLYYFNKIEQASKEIPGVIFKRFEFKTVAL